MGKSNLKAIAKTWAERAQAELAARTRFKLLTEQLMDFAANGSIIRLARKAQGDEERHAIMCAQVARQYGHPTGLEDLPTPSLQLSRSWELKLSAKECLLCEVTLMCCIIETANAGLLNTIYGHSKVTPTRNIIRQILKDEIKHGQIGWAYLAAESKEFDYRFLQNYLVEMFEIAVKDELFLPIADDLGDEDSFNYGVMPVGLRLKQFQTTAYQVIFPGLEKFGVDTGNARAWLQERVEGERP